MTNNEQLIAHIKERYTYDAEAGVVRNRKGQAIRGFKRREYQCMNVRINHKRNEISMHRIVWVLCYGRFPKVIDHVNGDEKDNRLENLREVTQRENLANRMWSWRPNAKTGLPGVYQEADDSFRIKCGAKHYYFRDKYEAFVTLTLLGRMFKAN